MLIISKLIRPLSYLPHQFPAEAASSRFHEHEQKRLFAPGKFEQIEGLVIHVNPLKKVLLPIFAINARILKTDYKGQYGIDRTVTHYDSQGKAHTRITTDWYSTSGTLKPTTYSPGESNMTIYGGLSWDAPPVEEAMEGFGDLEALKPFDLKAVDDETVVDPFLKRSALAQEEGNDRIESAERGRAAAHIEKNHWCNHTRVDKISITFDQFKLSSYLSPAYILQYTDNPPQIMPAFTHDVKIIGPGQLSIAKVMSATGAMATALSLFFPQVHVPARIFMILASSATSGLWAHFKLSVQNYFQKRRIASQTEQNETVAESKADQKRREATGAAFINYSSKFTFDIEKKHFEAIGLNPDQPITEEIIREAFNKKISAVHPDHNPKGSAAARDAIQAREAMLKAIKRKYSTSARRVKEPPRSVYHPSARKLIDTVLLEKNYEKAVQMVEVDEVPPDSHDKGENTLLATLVKEKRGTLKDIEFCIDKLNASVDTSCDCPAHRTALHYAASQGNLEKVKLLLEKGANPNLITSFGETALDLAIINGNEKVRAYIEEKGGVQHKTLAGSETILRKITGYKSNERTILLDKEDENKKIK